ncbi:MAG: hypothetical protein AB9M60_11605 [Leptothrix sp. (in: b-proteobacteria)]
MPAFTQAPTPVQRPWSLIAIVLGLVLAALALAWPMVAQLWAHGAPG